MKGKPVFPNRGGSKGKGSPEAKPRGTTAYHVFQQIAHTDMYTKLGGKEGFASNVRVNHQVTTKVKIFFLAHHADTKHTAISRGRGQCAGFLSGLPRTSYVPAPATSFDTPHTHIRQRTAWFVRMYLVLL